MAARHRAPRPRPHPGRRSRTIRAVLAGGLVLGIGVSVTTAAWTDTEVATGSFAASVFGTQSSVNGGITWADNTLTPAVLAFAAGGFSPTVTKYAALNLRTVPNSLPGTISLGAAVITADTGLVGGLQLRVVAYSGTGPCAAEAFSAGAAYVVGSSATPAALTAAAVSSPALTAAQGTPTTLCFQVSMPTGASSTFQGRSLTATWTVTSTSVG